jgi:hypothetical protein
MKRITYKLLIINSILIALTACQYEHSNIKNENNKFEPYRYEIEKQLFSFLAENDTTIIGKEGTIINLKSGSFSVDSGKIFLELAEYYSVSDMLLSNLSTMSGTNILETEGMFFINLKTENGDTVYLEDSKCTFQTPIQERKENVILFTGERNERDQMYWTVASYPTIPGDTSNLIKNYVNQAYFFNLTSLGWVNCDRFLEVEENTEVLVYNSGREGSYSLVLINYNSIIPGLLDDTGNITFSHIPVNEPVSLVGMANRDNELYYEILDFNSNQTGLIFPELKKIEQKTLKELFDKKFGSVL